MKKSTAMNSSTISEGAMKKEQLKNQKTLEQQAVKASVDLLIEERVAFNNQIKELKEQISLIDTKLTDMFETGEVQKSSLSSDGKNVLTYVQSSSWIYSDTCKAAIAKMQEKDQTDGSARQKPKCYWSCRAANSDSSKSPKW